MPLYAATIFVSAFLLFLIQPVIAKQILPWFGGSAAVWTTCLVFFQATLLAGYAYSDFVVHRLAFRTQVMLHAGLLALSLIVLPVIPGAQWKPIGTEDPSWLILGLLAATIGLPYFMLSTTSPIVQAWFAHAKPGRNPYGLFALSNIASMVALVGYPFLLEPWAPTRGQALGWSVGYACFTILCVAAGWVTLRAKPLAEVSVTPVGDADAPRRRSKRKGKAVAATILERAPSHGQTVAPPASRQVLWATLASTASLTLLAVSNHITQNLASVPLLWIAPLAIYLLTFVLCFSGTGWRHRHVFLAVLAVALCVMAYALADTDLTHELGLQLIVFGIGLFLICMFCHGELVRLKPAPAYLTRFYLMIALGGAVGSTLVGIVAPLVLPAYFELSAGLVVVSMLLFWQVRNDGKLFQILASAAFLVSILTTQWSVREYYMGTTFAARNFYGVLRVRNAPEGVEHYRSLFYGTIRHGMQFSSPMLKAYPTTYYVPTSGVGRLLALPRTSDAPLRVGIIGLGIGTLAAYGKKGDTFRFYDINPNVIQLAQSEFTYLKDSDATIEIALGDARLSLEREPRQDFDLLVVDAFFGDAIPIHLITKEAVTIYRKHLKPGGVIAFHVTNRFLDLVPVVAGLAQQHDLYLVYIADEGSNQVASYSAWILLSDKRELLDRPELRSVATTVDPRAAPHWTDDFNDLVRALR